MPKPGPDPRPAAIIDYTNHAGERAIRRILPKSVRYGTTPKDPEPAWVLDATDLDRDVERSFRLSRIHSWKDA